MKKKKNAPASKKSNKKSGGKRATEKKHRERAADRQRAAGATARELDDLAGRLEEIGPAPLLERDGIPHWLDQVALVARDSTWRKEWLDQLEQLGKPPATAEGTFGWLGRAAALLVLATMSDTAVPPEQMRRDAMRQIEQTAKVLDPAKLSDQLAELERALEELQEQSQHAGKDAARTPPTPPAGSSQH